MLMTPTLYLSCFVYDIHCLVYTYHVLLMTSTVYLSGSTYDTHCIPVRFYLWHPLYIPVRFCLWHPLYIPVRFCLWHPLYTCQVLLMTSTVYLSGSAYETNCIYLSCFAYDIHCMFCLWHPLYTCQVLLMRPTVYISQSAYDIDCIPVTLQSQFLARCLFDKQQTLERGSLHCIPIVEKKKFWPLMLLLRSTLNEKERKWEIMTDKGRSTSERLHTFTDWSVEFNDDMQLPTWLQVNLTLHISPMLRFTYCLITLFTFIICSHCLLSLFAHIVYLYF